MKNKINFIYKIDNFPLPKVETVHDFGTTFQSNLVFSPHIDQISLKFVRKFWFLIRLTSFFKNMCCLKIIYYALHCILLKYGSIMLCPFSIFQIEN